MTAMVITPSPALILRRAIDLSNRANSDPSFGEEACRLWRSVLSSEELMFPLEAMSAAHGLHACTLARIGKDKEAIVEYTSALQLLNQSGAYLNPITNDEMSIRVGMCKCLQRLYKYEDSADAFLEVATRCDAAVGGNGHSTSHTSWEQISRSNAIQSAALCFLRNGDLVSALATIEKYEGMDVEVDGMYGALLMLKSCSSFSGPIQDSERREIFQRAMKLLLYVSSDHSSSHLYRWIYLVSCVDKQRRIEPLHCSTDDTFLALARINNSAFDDPDLIKLDDKIQLHSILLDTAYDGFNFWPKGYILPDDYDCFRSDYHNQGWILKERNGYGSHGNVIASTEKVRSMYNSGQFVERILCQRIVNPPLLIGGRKFSLRIYVVYFPRGVLPGTVNESLDAGVYLSTEGLVKYAATTYNSGLTTKNPKSFDDQYMTNSGRGDGRSALQYNLVHLRNELQRCGILYHEMWEIIQQSVQIVMARYIHLQRDENPSQLSRIGQSFIPNSYLSICSIPKILGFDYILDDCAKPYLLEVNRFPGLEPRSSMDSSVKHTVVYDAWVTASDRVGLPNSLFRNFRPSNYKGSSLKKLI